ncbi:MAG: amidohydrolase family protein [Myxococcales bacterium]|nr:amidohydrolase family protein [Myxococcales bacterium]
MLVPTHVCPVSTTGYLEEPWDALDGPTTGHTEGPLTVGPVKLVFDGAPGCSMCLTWWQSIGASVRTMALAMRLGSWDPVRTMMSAEPRFGREVRSGIAIYRREEAERVVRGVVERGFSVATHAIGNEAIDVALSAYAAAGAGLHGAGVPRIEHASFLDPELVRRMAGAGVAAVVQPSMIAMPMLSTASPISGLPFFPLRWLVDAKVPVVGSSDYPVDVFDPLAGMRTAMLRRNGLGTVVEPGQALTLDEALAMYTRAAVEVIGCAAEAGTLEVGKRADLALIEGFEGELAAARVVATFVDGVQAFAAAGDIAASS